MSSTARTGDRLATTARRRWDSFREIDDVYQQINHLLQAMPADRTMAAALTTADVEETNDAYVVRLDVPGVKREDLDIRLDGSDLRVTGEIQEQERQGIMRRHERPVGWFEHVVGLPMDIDADSIDAKLSHGVLTMHVGKATNSAPKRIEIEEVD